MFRLTRPLFNQLRKTTTGITGLEVHHDPVPHLIQTYKSTLEKLSVIPETSVYRQGVEAFTKHKLNIVQAANGDIAEVEKQLDEGHIEDSLDVAKDELNLVGQIVEWKAYVVISFATYHTIEHSTQMGAPHREARARTVGVLWQDRDCCIIGLNVPTGP